MQHFEQSSRQEYYLVDAPHLQNRAGHEQFECYAAMGRWIVKKIKDLRNQAKFTGPLSLAGQ